MIEKLRGLSPELTSLLTSMCRNTASTPAFSSRVKSSLQARTLLSHKSGLGVICFYMQTTRVKRESTAQQQADQFCFALHDTTLGLFYETLVARIILAWWSMFGPKYSSEVAVLGRDHCSMIVNALALGHHNGLRAPFLHLSRIDRHCPLGYL